MGLFKIGHKNDVKNQKKGSKISKKKKSGSPKKFDSEFVEKLLEKGGLQARGMIEVVGHPEDHVKSVLNDIKNTIRKEYISNSVKIYKPKINEKLFQGFIDFDVLFENFDDFLAFCFKFYPSSVEIIAPSNFGLNLQRFNSFFNDMLAKIHEFGFALKDSNAEIALANDQLQKVISERNALLKNLILKSVQNNPGTLKDISERTGVSGDIETFVLTLVDSGSLHKTDDGRYIFIP